MDCGEESRGKRETVCAASGAGAHSSVNNVQVCVCVSVKQGYRGERLIREKRTNFKKETCIRGRARMCGEQTGTRVRRVK